VVALALLGLLIIILPRAASAQPAAHERVLVYASIRNTRESVPGNPDNFTDLFMIRIDGSGFRRLTRTTVWESSPAWAPNRQLIAYSRASPWCHGGSCDWDPLEASIWVIATDGRRQRPLTSGEEQDFIDDYPAWSPDSSKIAFARNSWDDADPQDGIYVVGVDGDGLERISQARAISLAWSPSGSTIAYVHRARYVGLIDVGTRGGRRLGVRGVAHALSVEWSPRGQFLAVATGKALFVVPAAGGVARKIVEAPGADYVSWSPDGCCLAYSAVPQGVRSGQADLYTVSVRGGRPRRLTKNRGPDFGPDWRP
jgi:Tol biopolymer transport system component